MNQAIRGETEKEDKRLYTLREQTPARAVVSMGVPLIAGMCIMVLYNLVDTFFIGLLHDDYQLAAVNLAYPVMMVMIAVSNMVGAGCSSLIARSMGAGDMDKARHTLTTGFVLTVLNSAIVAGAGLLLLPEIAAAVERIEAQLRKGGRLFYAGAGTSGRLGVLDAAECPPTYGVSPDLVVGLIAGGPSAFLKAVEGAEDSPALGRQDLIDHAFSDRDVLVGIAASGRTPYVIGAMDYARETGAPVIALVCCRNSLMSAHADITIAPVPGPEVITGSSRMKSGTCQKLVLNMLSTCVMVRLGKVYGNLMVDVMATNQKLVDRAVRIVCAAAETDAETARSALEKCGFSCKTAIVMLLLDLSPEEAEQALSAADGRIAGALQSAGINANRKG